MIDQASVFAERFRKNPQVLQATVLGQGNIPGLDPYTALNALRLIKESNAMQMANQAQGPTSSPSLVAENIAPQGLAGMMPMGAVAGQMPQGSRPAPQAPVMQASGGLAGLHTPDEDYAAGGIVAFAGDDDENDPQTGQLVSGVPAFTSTGDPTTYAALAKQLPGAIQGISSVTGNPLTAEEYKQIQMDEMNAYREAMGPNTAKEAAQADITARKGELGKNLEEGKGVALLKAAYAVTQGNNWARAFAGAGAAFGEEFNRALKADKEEKRSIALAEFNMADAQRKENLGLFKEGRAAADRAVTARQAADKAKLEKAKAYADAVTKGMNATKPLRSALGAGAGGPKLPQVDRETAAMQDKLVELQNTKPDDPQIPILEKKIQGRMKILATGKEGPTVAPRAAAALTAKQNAAVMKQMAIWEGGPEARKAKVAGNYDEVANAKKEAYRQDALRGVFDDDNDGGGAPAAGTPGNPIKLK